VKRITVIALLAFVLVTRTADADELPPPKGFESVESKQSGNGSFKLVHYIKPPGDFTCESQIWLEPLKPEFKRQHLFTFTNRAYALIDATETHIAIAHHEYSTDNLLWLFVRGSDGLFHRVPHEIRAAAIKEFSRQTGIHKTRQDFDHFDCYPDAWLENGQLRGYLKGDSHDNHFYLKPWYFIYDADHQKFVTHDFPENKDAFVQEQR
jgi:hypothetical protein